jgi:hypothetical protein
MNEIINKMKECKTLEDLYILRAELCQQLETMESIIEEKLPDATIMKVLEYIKGRQLSETMMKRSNLNYYRSKVEQRILFLEDRGVWLDSVPLPQTKRYPFFSEEVPAAQGV